MTTAALNAYSEQWSSGLEDRRYYWLQTFGLLVFVLLAVAIPQLTVPKPAVLPPPPPPPLTQLVLPARDIPPPPEIKKEEPKPKPEEKPQEKPKEKPVEASKEPVKPPPSVDDAREKAEQSGLLALKDDLADLRQAFDVDDTTASVKTTEAPEPAATLERQTIAQTANQQFATQDAAAVTQNVGRVALSAQGATNVKTSQLKGLADKDTVARNREAAAKNAANASGKGTSGRSEAQIRQILEANKSSLYTLYNRALRQNPLLRGKVVFELMITPQGTVSAVKIVQSELGDAKLERQLQLRLQAVQFGPANVSLTRSQWTIEFLPG